YHLPMPAPATSLRLSLPTRRSSVRSACEAARRVLAAAGIRLLGLHSQIGSQIFDTAGFGVAARRVLTLHARLGAELGYVPGELGLGGGYGIAYTTQDDPQSPSELAAGIVGAVENECAN